MSDRSRLDRFLCRLALASPLRAEMLHDIERGMYLKLAPEDDGRHVFVTGLARAGATLLTQEIHRTGDFGSLTCADMPFVLAPNLWAGIGRRTRKPGRRAGRAGGDGIEVDARCPEALDEVYWRIFDGAAYIAADGLRPHEPSAEFMNGYRDLIRLVLLRTDRWRYLSRNDNAILRLGALARAMPAAQFLVPLRRPVAHAASLLRQHRRFRDPDPFSRDCMTWLGRHEFGAAHRPFLFGSRPEGDPDGMDYWLGLWLAAHSALDRVEAEAPNVCFVPYEALSADPAVWHAVARRIGVRPGPATALRRAAPREPETHDADLARRAVELHARLEARGAAKLMPEAPAAAGAARP